MESEPKPRLRPYGLKPKKKKQESQPCPMCGSPIGVLSGSVDAICKNCGYKDPCCE